MARGSRLRTWASAILLGLTVPAWAQVPEEPPTLRPIPLGSLLLYPLASLEYEGTDNLFRTDDDRASATLASARAGVLFEVPFRESQLRFGYAGRLRHYGGVDLSDNVLHAARVDGDFQFASGAFVTVSLDGQDGAEDTQRFDPGGEITFRGENFSALSSRVEAGHESGRGRRLGVRVQTDRVRFDRTEPDGTGFFDTTSRSAGLTAWHRATETTTLTWEFSDDRQDLERPLPSGVDRRESDGWTASGGFRTRLGAGSRFDLLAGWTDREYISAASSSARTVVGRAVFSRLVPARASVNVRLERAVYPSVYLDNDYYVSTRLTGQLENSRKATIVLGVRGSMYRNVYPDSAPDRTDDGMDAAAWIGYGFRSGLVWKVTADWTRRDSNLAGLGFDAVSVGTSFELGSR